MRILSIDTSTSLASLALTAGDKVIAESAFSCDRTLSARLMPEIDRMLAMAGIGYGDIDLFAAAAGPGSFTGVRCGLATVQGLSMATDKPCAGFSTLAALAMNFSMAALPVCPMMDARKGEVYAGLYHCSTSIPVALIKDAVISPQQLLQVVGEAMGNSVIFAGEGALRYGNEIINQFGERALFAPFPLNASRAVNGALLALNAFQRGEAVAPSQLLPVYLRASEAEYAKLDRQKARHKQ